MNNIPPNTNTKGVYIVKGSTNQSGNITLEYPANSSNVNGTNPDRIEMLSTVIIDTTTSKTGDINIRSMATTTPVNEPFVVHKSPKISIPQTTNHDVDERDARLLSPLILGELGKFAEIGIEPDFIFRPTPELLYRGDVFFNVAGEIFPAIRMTLSAKLVVFKGLFEQTGTYAYKISQIDPAVFKLMLDFVNTEILNTQLIEQQQKFQQLLQVAHQFDLLALKERCEQALIDTPKNPENALGLLILAQACHAGNLKESLIDFIALQCPLICQSDPFVQLARSEPALFKEVYGRIIGANNRAS